MKPWMKFIIGLAVGCWGYAQMLTRPEDGCISILAGGLLMVSSIGRLLGLPDQQEYTGDDPKTGHPPTE